VSRNASRSSWTNSLDFSLGLDVALGHSKRQLELTVDVLNLLNLFDSSGDTTSQTQARAGR
jgi:hypothetical protein